MRALTEIEQYKVQTNDFGMETYFWGDGGYDFMEIARQEGWKAIAVWGKDGYDLGSWPYVIIFRKKEGDIHKILEYVEGDLTQWNCPASKSNTIIDHIAFKWWKHQDEDWVKEYSSVVDLPEELRGPCRP